MSALYQYTRNGAVLRLDDGACIPLAPGNADFDDFADYMAAGGECLPAPPLDPKEVARATLGTLEQSTMMNRGLREFLLVAMQDLAQRQAVIMGGGVTAAMILAGNDAWVRLVQINTQATQLRAQL